MSVFPQQMWARVRQAAQAECGQRPVAKGPGLSRGGAAEESSCLDMGQGLGSQVWRNRVDLPVGHLGRDR